MSKFKVGDKVRHPYEGDGVVIAIDAHTINDTQVSFQNRTLWVCSGALEDITPTPAEQWQKEAEEMYPSISPTTLQEENLLTIALCEQDAHIKARELAHAEQQQRDRELQGELDRGVEEIFDVMGCIIPQFLRLRLNAIQDRLRSLTSLPTEQPSEPKQDN